MSEVLKKLRASTDPLENDLATVYEHWQDRRRQQGLTASLGYEPRDINADGVEAVIASRVLKASSGFEEIDPNLSYEALVLRYSDRFLPQVVKAARERMSIGNGLLKRFQLQDIQFLLKAYPSEIFNENIGRGDPSEWIGELARIPMLVHADKYAQSSLLSGFCGFIWFNEQEKNGEKGRGLTALVQFGPMSVDGNAKVIDVVIFDRPVGKELLEAHKENSEFISNLHSYRLKRTWPINEDDASLLLSAVRKKIHQIDEYERQKPNPNEELNLERVEDATALRRIVMRYNQSAFRKALLSDRENACAISGTAEVSVLEAAHIIPFSERFADRDKLGNGMLLRSDIHKLFDAHLISVNPHTRTVVVSDRITSHDYLKLDGVKLNDAVFDTSLNYHFKHYLG